jgi:hypothetical protein
MAIDQTFVTRARTALAGPIACGCGLAACAAFVTIVDPGDTGVPACPFRALTGWWCPGCGLTRATHHLLRGQVGTALRYNLFVVLVLAAIAGSWATWMLEANGRRVPGWRRIPAVGWVAFGAAVVGFGVIRNLPGVSGLRG